MGAAARVGFGATTGRDRARQRPAGGHAGLPLLRLPGPGAATPSRAGRAAAARIVAEPLLGFLLGLALGLFLAAMALFFLALARFGGFALGLLACPRGSARRRASSSAILRSSASRTRASASAWARALRSSSVSVRSTTPDFGAGAARAGVRRARRGGGALLRRCLRHGLAAALRLARLPTVRRFTVSTTTCLERPWLKLWRTTPVSVRGFSVSVLPTPIFLSPGVFVSLIPIPFPILITLGSLPDTRSGPGLEVSPVRKRKHALTAGEEALACWAGKQGSMYHI